MYHAESAVSIISNRPTRMVGPVEYFQCVGICEDCGEEIIREAAGAGAAAIATRNYHDCPEARTCESCSRAALASEEGAPALGMSDLYFCPPGYGCASVDERGRARV